jgi:hypothetical protein
MLLFEERGWFVMAVIWWFCVIWSQTGLLPCLVCTRVRCLGLCSTVPEFLTEFSKCFHIHKHF